MKYNIKNTKYNINTNLKSEESAYEIYYQFLSDYFLKDIQK